MTALPALPERFLNSATTHGAYTKCLRHEKSLHEEPDSKERHQKLINVRIVGYIMLHWPTPEALRQVSLEVASCNEDRIGLIRQKYYDHLLRLCMLV